MISANFIRQNYPTISEAFRLRLQFVVARIAKWPESAQEVADESGVRVVPGVHALSSSQNLHTPSQWGYRRTRSGQSPGIPAAPLPRGRGSPRKSNASCWRRKE